MSNPATRPHPKGNGPATQCSDAGSMFVEIRGVELPPDVMALATGGTCRDCERADCVELPAYLRISYDKHEETMIVDRGVVRQIGDIVKLVEGKSRHVVFFIDNDMSASKERGRKAQWYKALDYVKERRSPYLFAFKMDRLGRRLSDIERLDDLCRTCGTRVITLGEGDIFATPAWPFLAALAKTEAMNISYRVRAAQASRNAKGWDSGGGNRPFGYAANRRDVIEDEKKTLRRMREMVLDGDSRSEIARKLNAEGTTRAHGGKWNARLVGATLTNPRYAGLRVHEGEIVGQGAWDAIFTSEEWDTLQAKLVSSTQAKRKGRRPATLLGGIARCAYCETPLQAGRAGKSLRPTYRCPKDAGGCGRIHRGRDAIDRFVVRAALEAANADLASTEGTKLSAEAEAIRSEIADTDLYLATLREDLASRKMDPDAYYLARDVAQSTLRTLRRRYVETIEALDTATHERGAREQWEAWTMDERRTYLRRKFAAVLVSRAIQDNRIVDGIELIGK